jgi:hypothetical protein
MAIHSPTCHRTALMVTALTLGLSSAAMAQRVTRDAETGALRNPTAAESKALDAAAAKAAAAKSTARVGLATGKLNPGPVRHANGMVSHELDESTLSYSVMRRNPDGSMTMVCVTGAEAAQQALQGTQALAAADKEHQHDHE